MRLQQKKDRAGKKEKNIKILNRHFYNAYDD